MIELKFFEDYISIKNIAEFIYCPRAGIYMYLNWYNDLTNPYLFKGTLFHNNLVKSKYKYRKNKVQYKNFLIFNRKLKVYGFCDLIEKHKDLIVPVEYKSGKPEINLFHKAHLCLEALCLSEMFKTPIDYGFIYFYQSNKRHKVIFDKKLENTVLEKIYEFKQIILHLNSLNKYVGCNKKGCSYYIFDNIPIVAKH